MLPLEVEKKVLEIKNNFPSAFLCSVESDMDGYEDVLYVVARPLSLSELSTLSEISQRDKSNGLELIIQTCVKLVFSLARDEEVELRELPLGSAEKIATEVFESAGIHTVEPFIEDLNAFRALGTTLMYEGARYIMKAFPQYTLRDVKNLTRTEFAELIMLAERIHGSEFQIEDPRSMRTEEDQNNRQLQAIHKEAKTNSKLFDFGEENRQLAEHM